MRVALMSYVLYKRSMCVQFISHSETEDGQWQKFPISWFTAQRTTLASLSSKGSKPARTCSA
ncbi:protein of unknown function [Candidatus Filomicrobium marinum]|uniref:Uncharacterized protein n=1 Tax=Candidatus Filomicrobium marinum TaxID=1608628 RepID=A0A0D6JER5_9HYPH|nr:protein of unknown function [Candidatus Filomicrobium marinum]CPR18843.1 protein of unknown function [Candidatus Filomicrobium marinum]